MDRDKLIRKLNSVGKEAFVSHYYLFKDYANYGISKASAIERLVEEDRSNENGAAIRLGNAKSIFNEQGNCEALIIIEASTRVSGETQRAARRIHQEDCDPKPCA